jgi:uncharacterized protein YegP (UPF0339 family)
VASHRTPPVGAGIRPLPSAPAEQHHHRKGRPTAAKFEIYKDTKGEFRWRLKSANGQTIATGGEGYASKTGCETASPPLSAMRPRRQSKTREPSCVAIGRATRASGLSTSPLVDRSLP